MGGAFDLYSDLLDGRDGRRVLHEAPGPAALEQLGVTADAFTGLRLQAQDRALTDDGTQRPEPPLELLESLSFGQLPLADELAQRLPLGRVEARGVDGEGAQQTDHGGGEPQAGGRSEFVDPGDGGIAAGFAAIDVEEAQCGQAQGHRHRIGVDNTQLPLFLGEFLARILRDEVVTAGEGGVEVASAVALHELGQDPDDAAGNIGGISDPLQGFHDVPLSGVRVVQPEGGDLSGRVEEAEQPLGIGHAAATAPLPPVPHAVPEGVAGDRTPDFEKTFTWLDLHTPCPSHRPVTEERKQSAVPAAASNNHSRIPFTQIIRSAQSINVRTVRVAFQGTADAPLSDAGRGKFPTVHVITF